MKATGVKIYTGVPSKCGERTASDGLRGKALVAVVQAADLWSRNDAAGRRRYNRARDWRVLAEREVRSRVRVCPYFGFAFRFRLTVLQAHRKES